MVKKKLLSVALVAVTVCSMIFTGCGSSAENTGNDTGKTDSDAQAGNTAGDVADVADDVEKPEKITIMVDGTFQATLADGQEEWVNKWEELTGIELEVIQPDHNAYYDVLGQTFASGPENWPDRYPWIFLLFRICGRGSSLGYDGCLEQFRAEEESQHGCECRRRQYVGWTSVRTGTWRRWRMYDFPQKTVAG